MRFGPATEGAPVALPPSDRGHRARVLELPKLGRLEVADAVHVANEGGRTIGLLVAHDAADTLWLLTLGLTPAEGLGRWRATVARVVCAGVSHTFSEDQAPTFTFWARGSGKWRKIKELEGSPGEPSPLRLVSALDA